LESTGFHLNINRPAILRPIHHRFANKVSNYGFLPHNFPEEKPE
jgi:hypothetical protein